MTPSMIFALLGVVSYLLGAIPFGLIVAKTRGVDIRKTGSGNIGATNVFRSVGKGPGIVTFALDVLKGFGPAFAFPLLAAVMFPSMQEHRLQLALVCGCSAIAGHNWPIYLGFKGGKGIATSAGVLLGVAPLAVCAGLGTWIVVFLITRYVSVASILASIAVAASSWYFHMGADNETMLLPSALTVLAVFAILRHTSNIRRLIRGTESRFEFGKKKSQSDQTSKKT